MSTTIHQEITLPANAQRVYEALIDQTQHSAFTGGAPTEISRVQIGPCPSSSGMA